MAFLDRDGAQIFYELSEPAPTSNKAAAVVTLVNGHTRSSGDFRMMTRQLNVAGIQTLILDNRASGKSTVSKPFTLRDMEDDIIGIWDHLDLGKVSLLGISMGGFISQGIAARAADRVDRLILVSTGAGPEWIRPTGGGWINEGKMIEDKLASYFAPGFINRNQLLFETMVRQTKAAIAGGRFAERSDQQRDALKATPRDWSYDQITAKTLIIHGDEDAIVDVGAALDLNKKIKNSEVVILPGVGHLILAEASKALYEHATSWLKS